MAQKSKEPLRREHLTDEQWEAFGNVCEFIRDWKRRKYLARLAAGGPHMPQEGTSHLD